MEALHLRMASVLVVCALGVSFCTGQRVCFLFGCVVTKKQCQGSFEYHTGFLYFCSIPVAARVYGGGDVGV